MVGDAAAPQQEPIDETDRLIADVTRLRDLRISIRRTADGLGIDIPPSGKPFLVAFLTVWLCGWAVGEFFVVAELLSGGVSGPGLFLLIWVIPWTFGGAWVLWTILWQLFGVERLFFTAGALVREWGLLSLRGRRVVNGEDIRDVSVENSMGNDMAGIGTIKVRTAGRSMRIGNGLSGYEAELVVMLIRNAARRPGPDNAGARELPLPA